MTRFARAKGSKSSNEKTPDDGTPWEVMKNQLLESKKQNEDAKKRDEVEQQRIDNYQKFLKEQKVQKRKATWCDFPGTEQSKKKYQAADKKGVAVESTNKNKIAKPFVEPHKEVSQGDSGDTGANVKSAKKNKKKVKQNPNRNTVDEPLNPTVNDASPSKDVPINTEVKKKKKKVKKPKTAQEGNVSNKESNSELYASHNQQKNPDQQKNKNKKMKKFDDNSQASRRKPINDNSFQFIINGKEVDLVRFEGFPIMKKDADRLSELKGNMMKKGIPKSEVQRTIKLERRRAEKALARLKRDVCYNCRKGGHNLSDCPELKSNIPGVDAGDGMCFKCGSTEHRQFECKVQRDKEFRFATCFICKDQGHIARQCPDNPKGLYPNGGACKLCGDVTHLRKDCPTVKDTKEETSIKLATLNDDEIEGIAQQSKPAPSEEKAKKPKKITF